MVAAYNAGPRQVRRWMSKYPITDKIEVDIWIETLPWGETRNYLKSVMAFYAVYLHRLKQDANLAAFLHQDIDIKHKPNHHSNPRKGSLSVNQPTSQNPKNAPIQATWLRLLHP